MMKTVGEISILRRPTKGLIFYVRPFNISLQKNTGTNNSRNSILNNSYSMNNCRTMNNKRKYFELGLSPQNRVMVISEQLFIPINFT